jgi:hypothetical protein
MGIFRLLLKGDPSDAAGEALSEHPSGLSTQFLSPRPLSFVVFGNLWCNITIISFY